MKTIEEFWQAQAQWSHKVFGPSSVRGPLGPLKHLAKEALEAQANPADLEEYADCLFLVIDSCWRAGFTFDELLEACWRKLEKNKARVWSVGSPDEPVEHVRKPGEKNECGGLLARDLQTLREALKLIVGHACDLATAVLEMSDKLSQLEKALLPGERREVKCEDAIRLSRTSWKPARAARTRAARIAKAGTARG